MTNLNENFELQELLCSYFDQFSAEDSNQNLECLLQSWLSPDPELTRSRIELANMVFFVNVFNRLLRQASSFQGYSSSLDDFFDMFSYSGTSGYLNEMLLNWISPITADKEIEAIKASNMVDFVIEVDKLLFVLADNFNKEAVSC